jgi:Major Facilitator Superfamily
VLFYTGTFYALFFLERIARVDPATVTLLGACALLVAAPLTLLGGALSDRVGRKPVLLASLALAALLCFPLFEALLSAANPALARARVESPVVVDAYPVDCTLQFDPVGNRSFDARSCDVVRLFLARAGVNYSTRPLAAPGAARLEVGDRTILAPGAAVLAGGDRASAIAGFQRRAGAALADAGYRAQADPAAVDRPRVVAILACLLAIAAFCTGAYASMLVELFPARIRYSALSVPQNVGNGWFGGLLPASAFAIVAATGDVFAGLWYPVIVAGLSLLVALLAVPETRGRPMG